MVGYHGHRETGNMIGGDAGKDADQDVIIGMVLKSLQ